jgi:4a-hydroxytetrahydrobiopterin dehydratase
VSRRLLPCQKNSVPLRRLLKIERTTTPTTTAIKTKPIPLPPSVNCSEEASGLEVQTRRRSQKGTSNKPTGCGAGRAVAGFALTPIDLASNVAAIPRGRVEPMERLSNQQILDAGLVDWRKLAQAVHARYVVPDYVVAAAFVAAVAEVAEADAHHPDVKLTYGVIDVSLCTHEDGLWVTQKDIDMARKISEIARDKGLVPEAGSVTQLEIALDTAHEDSVAVFWSALLTGSPDNKIYDTIFDPTDRVPSMWFQSTDDHQVPRQRWHFDLWLAPETVDQRIAAAVAAGGSIVNVSEAPTFTVLADPDGNRVCICCATGR